MVLPHEPGVSAPRSMSRNWWAETFGKGVLDSMAECFVTLTFTTTKDEITRVGQLG